MNMPWSKTTIGALWRSLNLSGGRREVLIGNRRIVLVHPSIEVRRLPDHGAKVHTVASDTAPTGGFCVGDSSGSEPYIFLCSGAGVECDRITWLKAARVGTSHLGDGYECPVELLLSAEGDADAGYRHRILAEVYHLDAEAAHAVVPHPATGNDLQPQPGALQEEPEIRDAKHDSDDCGDNGEHAGHAALAVSEQQPGKGTA